MRRLTRVLSFALLAVCLSPLPAHAYFWEWLDSLSGPKFGGGSVELQLWCVTEKRADILANFQTELEGLVLLRKNDEGEIQAFEKRLKEFQLQIDEGKINRTELPSLAPRLQFVQRGLVAAREAIERFNTLKTTGGKPTNRARAKGAKSSVPEVDAGEEFWEALQWRDYAMGQLLWASQVEKLAGNDPALQAAAVQKLPIPRFRNPKKQGPQVGAGVGYLVGVSTSVCLADAIDRHKQALNLTFEFAWDHKEGAEASNNRMRKLGLSYHFIFAPWVRAGFGAGGARFYSGEAPMFRRWYIEPSIVDIKPLAIGQHKYSPQAWRQVFYVRVNSLWFPGGFPPLKFGDSPRLRNELVTAIGVHADLSPIIRKARRTF
jgi:hypothetical protein